MTLRCYLRFVRGLFFSLQEVFGSEVQDMDTRDAEVAGFFLLRMAWRVPAQASLTQEARVAEMIAMLRLLRRCNQSVFQLLVARKQIEDPYCAGSCHHLDLSGACRIAESLEATSPLGPAT